jgi:hypothetical protein
MDLKVTGMGKSLGAAILFRIARTACERLSGVNSPTAGGKDDALVSIVFSAASVEGGDIGRTYRRNHNKSVRSVFLFAPITIVYLDLYDLLPEQGLARDLSTAGHIRI